MIFYEKMRGFCCYMLCKQLSCLLGWGNCFQSVEQGNLPCSTAADTHGFVHAAASLVSITNPGINLLLAEGTQPCQSNMLGLDAALQSKQPSSPPTP